MEKKNIPYAPQPAGLSASIAKAQEKHGRSGAKMSLELM